MFIIEIRFLNKRNGKHIFMKKIIVYLSNIPKLCYITVFLLYAFIYKPGFLSNQFRKLLLFH